MNSAVIDELRHEANAKLDPKQKGPLGQFMTPSRIAEFMASLFASRANATLLDAGAGIGSLALAASKVLQLNRIEVWEVDPVMQFYLERNLDQLDVPYQLHRNDFILDSIDRIQFHPEVRFTHAILNPPYKKINSNSVHRKACRQVGLETVNLYTAFLALTIMQMASKGEIVIIIPRSFCNGPYYKPFRELMLKECSIDAIHVFESRSKAFADDEVLQESIILKLTRDGIQGRVLLSGSHDASFSDLHQREVESQEIIQPGDKELFIRVPTQQLAGNASSLFTHTLRELDIEVCTGPVVDFRLKEWWRHEPGHDTVPLLYPHHFTKDGFQYPKEHKKPNALVRSAEVDKWLMLEGVYVLVKRFSAKEERRRVVAYVVVPEEIKSPLVAFENHWNVFHFKKRGLDRNLASGLACFLNSTALDNYFRVFSGHTQVNATDLRNMKYPSTERLMVLGKQYQQSMTQEDIDDMISNL